MKRTTLLLPVVVTCALVTGCTDTSKLAPVFRTNERNIADLRENTGQILELATLASEAVLADEIQYRRSVVEDRLIDVVMMCRGSTFQQVLDDNASSLAKDDQLLRAALAAFPNDAAVRNRYFARYPVLAAHLSGALSAAQIQQHLALFDEHGAQMPIADRNTITDQYSYVAKAITDQDESRAELALCCATMERQLDLAVAHARLFSYAAETGVDIEQAFQSVWTETDLQSELLGLIPSEEQQLAITDLIEDIQRLRAASQR
ncbi:MAG: hypothetical protein KAS72_11745 [Phycisphaerales bacterium]|nr:hypothetical protein [Phycisphaerales bacterium]